MNSYRMDCSRFKLVDRTNLRPQTKIKTIERVATSIPKLVMTLRGVLNGIKGI